jgi:phosphotransferase system enzyme I (PtsI)
MTVRLEGLGVSAGTAIGALARMGQTPRLPSAVPPVDSTDWETERARTALADVSNWLQKRAESLSGEAADILVAESLMAADPALAVAVEKLALDGRPAPWAVSEALAGYQQTLLAAGGYLAERAADLDDIANRAVALLLDEPMPGLPAPGHPYILVASDLAPADTATLNPSEVLAIVTERGGPTSHTAILSKTLGIPAVVSCHGIGSVADGAVLGVDGSAGTVLVDPSAVEVGRLREAAAARAARRARSHGPGRTRDGHPVKLLVNIGGPADVESVIQSEAEGVGLFRTEFLYLDRTDAPSLAEQVDAYLRVFAPLGARKVVVRTLDAGADKPLAFASEPNEPNPALGMRGYRLDRLYPGLLDDQLSAIAMAARETAADVWVMAPMVATPAEAASFTAAARDRGLPLAGVMIEVPAAALAAARVLEYADFVSLGTNDLSQYTFAADRQVGELANLLDPWQPALLQLVAATATAGTAAGKPVSVCGEAASDPLLAVVLTGMGVTSLSMAAGAIADVRAALADVTIDQCRAAAAAALDASDPDAARHAAASVV